MLVDTVDLTDDVGFGLFIGYTSYRMHNKLWCHGYGDTVSILKHPFEIMLTYIRRILSVLCPRSCSESGLQSSCDVIKILTRSSEALTV